MRLFWIRGKYSFSRSTDFYRDKSSYETTPWRTCRSILFFAGGGCGKNARQTLNGFLSSVWRGARRNQIRHVSCNWNPLLLRQALFPEIIGSPDCPCLQIVKIPGRPAFHDVFKRRPGLRINAGLQILDRLIETSSSQELDVESTRRIKIYILCPP